MEFVLDRDNLKIEGGAGTEEYSQLHCPRNECDFTFLVLHDWIAGHKDEHHACPNCGHTATLPSV